MDGCRAALAIHLALVRKPHAHSVEFFVVEMSKKQKSALNMAKFLKTQSLELLGKLEALDMDEQAGQCEQLHEQAEVVFLSVMDALRAQSVESIEG